MGELLALTPADIDFSAKTISVTKSYQRIKGEDYITDPKTEKSNRTVSIPDFLCEELQEYLAMLYGFKDDDRMFQITKSFLHHEMIRGSEKAGVKRIRIHDIGTRMSSTRQKIYLCKSRNPKLSIDFDSLRFLFLCIVPLQLTAVENANQCLAFSTALLSALSCFNPTDSVC